MFIPFAFAWVKLEDMPHDAETEAYVALAGPMLGTVAAIGAYFLARDNGTRGCWPWPTRASSST